MDKKALTKTILCIAGVFAYLTLAAIACATESPVFIGVALGPIVIIGIVMAGMELYEIFKEDDK